MSTAAGKEREVEPARLPGGVRWYALHTRSRHEHKVLAELERRQQEAFLPEYRTVSRRRDRRKLIYKPLFPGYLFVHTALDPGRRLELLQTPSVVRLVGVRHHPLPIPDTEVESIRMLLGATADAQPRDGLGRGQLVQVVEGPLQGVVGRVEKSPRGRTIVVSVELLGRSVAASLDRAAVEPYLDL